MILCQVVILTLLEALWSVYLQVSEFFHVLSSIASFVKQTIYCLGVEILIVYYQISFLLLVLESFNAWYWFTFLFILLLPVIGFFRFPENPMLLHGLCSCLEPLLLFLRTGVLLRFGIFICVGILFIPEAACFYPKEGSTSNVESTSNARSEGAASSGSSSSSPQHSPVQGYDKDHMSIFTSDSVNELRKRTSTYIEALEDSKVEQRVDETARQSKSLREGGSGTPYPVRGPRDPDLSELEKARIDVEVSNMITGQKQPLPGTARHMGGQVPKNEWEYDSPRRSTIDGTSIVEK